MKNKIMYILHETISEIMELQGNEPETQKIQNIIAMIHTLIVDGKANELNEVLNFHFPEYYISKPKLMASVN